MSAYTSSQTGNWSSPSTWGGAGVPVDGDTVSIGAHTVTVDANTTVGTSPNNNTTKVIDRTSASSKLIIAAGVTLTVKGNIGGVHGSTWQMEAGSTLVFDASGSGGTPVYTFINAGGDILVCNGSSSQRCAMRSVNSSYTCSMASATVWKSVSYTDFLRFSSLTSSNASVSGVNNDINHCTFTSCATLNITFPTATLSFSFTDNVFSSSTNSTESVKLTLGTARTSGNRIFSRNVCDKAFNNSIKNMTEMNHNVIGGITCWTGGTTSFNQNPRNNFIGSSLNLNSGNGMLTVGSWDRLYVAIEGTTGNPHFLAPNSVGADATYTQVIFESQHPDLLDTGDCFLAIAGCCASGTKIIAKNCVVLPSGYSGSTVHSGQLLTSYNPPASNATNQFQAYRSTVNQNDTSVGSVGKRAAFAIAEAATGAADQLSALKSNLVWAASAGNGGYIAERISGTVKDHITAASVDYNWTHNLSAGDNQRSYEDRANSPAQTMWTAGDAVAASVDVHQGSGNPSFVDSARNVAAWCSARGYGAATYAAGKTALQADPTRVEDLIDYVFEGYRVGNASMRTAAHDGGCVGAANYYNSTRSTSPISRVNSYLSNRYAVSI